MDKDRPHTASTRRQHIDVLVVDDSQLSYIVIKEVLESDPSVRVCGRAANGEEALKFLAKSSPDVVTMDLMMPGMLGSEVTRRIMETRPVPVVIVTSAEKNGLESFGLLAAGAVAVVEKPPARHHPDYAALASSLLRTVKTMSGLRLVRRRTTSQACAQETNPRNSSQEIKYIAIGASTGGPPVIREILSKADPTLGAPILITQHISRGFTEVFVSWLKQASNIDVRVAHDLEKPVDAVAYVAPDDRHMGIDRNGRIFLSEAAREHHLRPAVSFLFRSLVEFEPAKTMAVLLTGMGKDGALELARLRRRGALTVAQDQESSLVFGMPGEAVALDGASLILSASDIANHLSALASGEKPFGESRKQG